MEYLDMLYEGRMIIAVVIFVCFVAVILWHIISPIAESYKDRKCRSGKFEKKCADCAYFVETNSIYCNCIKGTTSPCARVCSDFKERYVKKH